jgi:hypothetical protein
MIGVIPLCWVARAHLRIAVLRRYCTKRVLRQKRRGVVLGVVARAVAHAPVPKAAV